MTDLDHSLALMRQDVNDRDNQAKYYDLVLNTTFLLPIVDETAEERVAAGRDAGEPMLLVIDVEGIDYLMLFDTRQRLTAWAEGAVPFVEIPGHALARFSSPPLHWTLNVGTDFSKLFLPEEITWLREAVERCEKDAETKTKPDSSTPHGGSMPTANARHLLVGSEAECLKLKAEIEAGADFAAVAKGNSSCPSRMQGGDLGTFCQGQMVPEFDTAVFTGEIGTLLGPIQTQFGFHLIEVTKRW